jgi:E3 SUMO-protein ligase NSE2
LNDLQPDKNLEKRVKAAARRMQRQEEDSDGDEVIE